LLWIYCSRTKPKKYVARVSIEHPNDRRPHSIPIYTSYCSLTTVLVAGKIIRCKHRAELGLLCKRIKIVSHPFQDRGPPWRSILLRIEALRLLEEEKTISVRATPGWRSWGRIGNDQWVVASCERAVGRGLKTRLHPVRDRRQYREREERRIQI